MLQNGVADAKHGTADRRCKEPRLSRRSARRSLVEDSLEENREIGVYAPEYRIDIGMLIANPADASPYRGINADHESQPQQKDDSPERDRQRHDYQSRNHQESGKEMG